MAPTQADLKGALSLLASGKVRDLYEVDPKTLLFVASDRISAYDVIMSNVGDFHSLTLSSSGLRPFHLTPTNHYLLLGHSFKRHSSYASYISLVSSLDLRHPGAEDPFHHPRGTICCANGDEITSSKSQHASTAPQGLST